MYLRHTFPKARLSIRFFQFTSDSCYHKRAVGLLILELNRSRYLYFSSRSKLGSNRRTSFFLRVPSCTHRFRFHWSSSSHRLAHSKSGFSRPCMLGLGWSHTSVNLSGSVHHCRCECIRLSFLPLARTWVASDPGSRYATAIVDNNVIYTNSHSLGYIVPCINRFALCIW